MISNDSRKLKQSLLRRLSETKARLRRRDSGFLRLCLLDLARQLRRLEGC